MEYHLGDSIAIGSGGVEFKDKENPSTLHRNITAIMQEKCVTYHTYTFHCYCI